MLISSQKMVIRGWATENKIKKNVCRILWKWSAGDAKSKYFGRRQNRQIKEDFCNTTTKRITFELSINVWLEREYPQPEFCCLYGCRRSRNGRVYSN